MLSFTEMSRTNTVAVFLYASVTISMALRGGLGNSLCVLGLQVLSGFSQGPNVLNQTEYNKHGLSSVIRVLQIVRV
jgi:hypothetical protein